MGEGRWIYFGCERGAGHYLHEEGTGSRMYGRPGNPEKLSHFDGMLAPRLEKELYVASVTRLGGWGLTALSWWDRSVDKRPGSNSIIFAPSLTITEEELLSEAQRRFPWAFARLPQPVTLAESRPTPSKDKADG